MSKLLGILDFIILSVLRRVLSPKALIRLKQSASAWRLEDVDKIFEPEDNLYKIYLKAYVRIAITNKKLNLSRLENSTSYKWLTSWRLELIRKYQTFSIVEGSPSTDTQFISSFTIFRALREIDKSINHLKMKCSTYSISDSLREKEIINKRDATSKLKSFNGVSPDIEKVKNYSTLPYSTTAPRASHSSSFPTFPSTDYIDDVPTSRYYPTTPGFIPYSSYTTATKITPASYPTLTSTPGLIDYISNGIPLTCDPETSKYYSQPSNTTATPIASASHAVPPPTSIPIDYIDNLLASYTTTPIPSSIDYTSNGVPSTYYPETCEYYSKPSYTNASTINSASCSVPPPIPSLTDYTSNGVPSTCYPESCKYYLQSSYATASTTVSASCSISTPIPSPIEYIKNLEASTCYPETSSNLDSSHNIATKRTPTPSSIDCASDSYPTSTPTPTPILNTSNGVPSTCYPETCEYYSKPSYTNASTITSASHSIPASAPSSIDCIYNLIDSLCYPETPSNLDSSHNIAAKTTPTPSSIDCASNGVPSTCYPEPCEYYSQPSNTTATTIDSASYSIPTVTPTPIDCIKNLIASLCNPETSNNVDPSHTIAKTKNPASYPASTSTPTPIYYTLNGIARTRYS